MAVELSNGRSDPGVNRRCGSAMAPRGLRVLRALVAAAALCLAPVLAFSK
jgi:hypothetical protein